MSPTALTKVKTLSGHTKDGQWLTHSFGMGAIVGSVARDFILHVSEVVWP
jgi:hypothetical protein